MMLESRYSAIDVLLSNEGRRWRCVQVIRNGILPVRVDGIQNVVNLGCMKRRGWACYQYLDYFKEIAKPMRKNGTGKNWLTTIEAEDKQLCSVAKPIRIKHCMDSITDCILGKDIFAIKMEKKIYTGITVNGGLE